MTIQLNDLKEISKEIQTQDNYGTSNPIFILIDKEKVPTHRDYSDDYFYYDHDNQCEYKDEMEVFKSLEGDMRFHNLTEFREKLKELWENEDFDEFIETINNEGYEQYSRIHYLWKPVFKQLFFTKKSAEAYLEENAHHFDNPVIYCDSLWRNEEMKTIRNNLIQINGGKLR